MRRQSQAGTGPTKASAFHKHPTQGGTAKRGTMGASDLPADSVLSAVAPVYVSAHQPKRTTRCRIRLNSCGFAGQLWLAPLRSLHTPPESCA